MSVLTWICMMLNSAIVLFLTIMLFNPNQDAAGKGMLFLPILILLACCGGSWLLMKNGYAVAAFLVSAIPALIGMYFLYLSLQNSQ